ERMQRGRKREHYQWNLDIVGEGSVMAEAEVIGAAVAALRKLGLTHEHFKVRVGDRQLLSAFLQYHGVAREKLLSCFLALDKKGKIENEQIRKLIISYGLAEEGVDRLFNLVGQDASSQMNYLANSIELLNAEDEITRSYLWAYSNIRDLFKYAE